MVYNVTNKINIETVLNINIPSAVIAQNKILIFKVTYSPNFSRIGVDIIRNSKLRTTNPAEIKPIVDSFSPRLLKYNDQIVCNEAAPNPINNLIEDNLEVLDKNPCFLCKYNIITYR